MCKPGAASSAASLERKVNAFALRDPSSLFACFDMTIVDSAMVSFPLGRIG